MKGFGSKVLAMVLAIPLCAGLVLAQGAKATMPAHEFGFGGHMLGFFTDYLDLTDAQQAQIKAIITKEKPIVQPLIQQLAQTHQQLRQLEESSTFDEAKVRAVAAQQSQTLVDLIVEKSRAKSEMIQVLTPDQKTRLQKFEDRRQQRMLNHMQDGEPANE